MKHKTQELNPRVVRTWRNIVARCQRGKGQPNYGDRGIQCLITPSELQQLWERDGAASMKRPSIDRIDRDGDYTLENCEFVELVENLKRKNGAHRSRGSSREDEFLTPIDAMRILKIGRAAFYGMIADGKIPGAIKVGNQWRINPKVFWQSMEEKSAS